MNKIMFFIFAANLLTNICFSQNNSSSLLLEDRYLCTETPKDTIFTYDGVDLNIDTTTHIFSFNEYVVKVNTEGDTPIVYRNVYVDYQFKVEFYDKITWEITGIYLFEHGVLKHDFGSPNILSIQVLTKK